MKKLHCLLLLSAVMFAFMLTSCDQSDQVNIVQQEQELIYETGEDETVFNMNSHFSSSRSGCNPLYFRFQQKNSGQSLTGPDTSGQTIQFPWTGNDNQMWSIAYHCDGYFIIKSKSTGDVLSVNDSSIENGAPVVVLPWQGLCSKLWRISYAGEGCFKFRSKQGSLVLSVPEGAENIGAGVIQSDWTPWMTKANQKWKIEIAPELPAEWEAMEIESKWETDRLTYRRLVDDFPEDGTKYGYKLNVRWKGIPRKYVDTYYDNAGNTVSQDRHAFRHRVRYQSKPRAENDEIETLENAAWEESWQKVQYKGTASIIDAVWFRTERGDDKISTSEAMAVINGNDLTHDAAQLALSYRPDFDFSTMAPVMLVTDYRYRVEFLDENDDPVFELSLDRATLENMRDNTTSELTEVELEIVKENYTRSDLDKLFELSYLLQREYSLTPSTKSKGEN